jgi:hypothetical protein
MRTRQVGSAGMSGTGGAGPAGRTRCVSNASATASSDLQRTTSHINKYVYMYIYICVWRNDARRAKQHDERDARTPHERARIGVCLCVGWAWSQGPARGFSSAGFGTGCLRRTLLHLMRSAASVGGAVESCTDTHHSAVRVSERVRG